MRFKTDRPKITTPALTYFIKKDGSGFDRRYALRVIPVLNGKNIAFFSLILKDGNKKKVSFDDMLLVESEPFNEAFIYRSFTPKVDANRFWKRLVGHNIYLQLPHSLIQDGEDRGIVARFRYSGKTDFYLRERIKGTSLKKLYWINRLKAYVFLIPLDQRGNYFPEKVRVKVDEIAMRRRNPTPLRKKIGNARRKKRRVRLWVHNYLLPAGGEVNMFLFEGIIKSFDTLNLYLEANGVVMSINRVYLWRMEYAD